MARRQQERPSLEQAVRAVVMEVIDRRLARLPDGGGLAQELSRLKGVVARIERSLARPSGGGRRAKGSGPGRPPLHVGCQVRGCRAEHYARGLCSKHYQQARRGNAALGRSRRRPKRTRTAGGRRR